MLTLLAFNKVIRTFRDTLLCSFDQDGSESNGFEWTKQKLSENIEQRTAKALYIVVLGHMPCDCVEIVHASFSAMRYAVVRWTAPAIQMSATMSPGESLMRASDRKGFVFSSCITMCDVRPSSLCPWPLSCSAHSLYLLYNDVNYCRRLEFSSTTGRLRFQRLTSYSRQPFSAVPPRLLYTQPNQCYFVLEQQTVL